MWGVVPAAGIGSRIQPLAFSKELLPLGGPSEGAADRPRAVSEYLVERMVLGGATRICMVIAPGKSDLVAYHGDGRHGAPMSYVVQPRPLGLCDALFRALPVIAPGERILVGLPDTVWFPADALRLLDDGGLSFLCFPVGRPEHFDAVVADDEGRVEAIDVKASAPRSRWIWGAFKLPREVLEELYALWCARGREDQYFGTLVNAWLSAGGRATAVRAGEQYVDVGTLDGYREAMRVLAERSGR